MYQGGDNVWKIYADDFYQDALDTAFKFNGKGVEKVIKHTEKTLLIGIELLVESPEKQTS